MARGDEDGELLTSAAYKSIETELAELEGPKRKEVVQAIATARAHGDLSENFEYHAAKNEQGLLEARIRVLQPVRAASSRSAPAWSSSATTARSSRWR